MTSRYVDAVSAAAYDDFDGQEVVVTRLVAGSTSAALDAWLQRCWVAPSTTVASSSDRWLVGHRRRVLGVIEEQIVAVGAPSDSLKTDAIPTVCYKVLQFGPLPLVDHLALVRFVPASETSTLVVWTVKVVPSPAGGVLCCGGSIVRLALRPVLANYLSAMPASSDKIE